MKEEGLPPVCWPRFPSSSPYLPFFHLRPAPKSRPVLLSQKLRLQLKHVFIFQWRATSQYPSDLNSREIFVVRALGNALNKVSNGSHSFLVTHFENTTRHLGNIFSECTREVLKITMRIH